MGGGRAMVNHFWVHFFILLSIFAISQSEETPDCVYTVYVKTASLAKAGTDSNIILSLFPHSGHGIRINNLVAWGGLMGPGHDYFEKGQVDIFSGRGPCLSGPVCAMNLTSDGSGKHHSWYCEYVAVTATGLQSSCSQQKFIVDQWLAYNMPPYELSVIRNNCLRKVIGGSETPATISVM